MKKKFAIALFAFFFLIPAFSSVLKADAPLEQVVASINAGVKVQLSDPSVARAKALLADLSKKYHAPAAEVSNMVFYTYKEIKKSGDSRTSFFDLIEFSAYGVPDFEKETKQTLAQALSLYQMNRADGTSHTLALIRVTALLRSLPAQSN